MDNAMLLVSPAPHVRQKTDTRSIMFDVIIAMIPAFAASVEPWNLKPNPRIGLFLCFDFWGD